MTVDILTPDGRCDRYTHVSPEAASELRGRGPGASRVAHRHRGLTHRPKGRGLRMVAATAVARATDVVPAAAAAFAPNLDSDCIFRRLSSSYSQTIRAA
jgi:hypothetical protein